MNAIDLDELKAESKKLWKSSSSARDFAILLDAFESSGGKEDDLFRGRSGACR